MKSLARVNSLPAPGMSLSSRGTVYTHVLTAWNRLTAADNTYMTVFMIEICYCSYEDPEVKAGDVVCYGQPVALVTLPEEGGQVYQSLL